MKEWREIKENVQNTKIENLKKWAEKVWRENLAYLYSWGKNLKKNNFFKF